MNWWQIIGVFAGIPALLAVGISMLVYWLTDDRVPDGIAKAAEQQRSKDMRSAEEPGEDSDPP